MTRDDRARERRKAELQEIAVLAQVNSDLGEAFARVSDACIMFARAQMASAPSTELAFYDSAESNLREAYNLLEWASIALKRS